MRPHHAPRPAFRAAMLLGSCAPLVCALGACQTGSSGANPNSRSVIAIFAPPTPQESAAWAIDPYDADKRQRGLLLLANAQWGGEEVYVDLYRAAMSDGDAGVRISAIKALGLHGTPQDAPAIAAELDDPDRLVRWASAQSLQRIHAPEVVPALLGRLDPSVETDFDVRAACAVALGQYAENRVLDGLIGSLNDPNLLVNVSAAESLKTLTGHDGGQDVRAWVAWVKDTSTPFADRKPYEYPVFHRDKTLLEWVVPFMAPPNEVAAAPVGMPPPEKQARSASSAERDDGSVRQN